MYICIEKSDRGDFAFTGETPEVAYNAYLDALDGDRVSSPAGLLWFSAAPIKCSLTVTPVKPEPFVDRRNMALKDGQEVFGNVVIGDEHTINKIVAWVFVRSGWHPSNAQCIELIALIRGIDRDEKQWPKAGR